MKDEIFDELLESVKQADAVMRGKAKPSRVFEHPDPEVVANRCKGLGVGPRQRIDVD